MPSTNKARLFETQVSSMDSSQYNVSPIPEVKYEHFENEIVSTPHSFDKMLFTPKPSSIPCIKKGITFYVDIKTTQHQCFQPSHASDKKKSRLQTLYLPTPTVESLIICLSSKLSLHPSQISEVLCYHFHNSEQMSYMEKSERQRQQEENYMPVSDMILIQHLPDHAFMLVEWEIKQDGTVRLLLQF
ncbi:hypothetical protein BDF14DRAFT_74109 [Spinellus fusiger]|nr:hypothetical protein BDF14DRAFT_74109 [Spinellus fusiger]